MISNFKEIRRDEKVIPESLTVDDMAALGWSPEKVTTITWDNDGKAVELHARHGSLSKVLPDREGIAYIENEDEAGICSTLSMLNADGSVRFSVPNMQVIKGNLETGTYSWYEPARSKLTVCLGVVFRLARNEALFQVDIDVHNGSTVAVYPLR